MAAMSTYPRLPFRPVPLTLALRKPTHPPPISIVRSSIRSSPSPSSTRFRSPSNDKMALSSLLSPHPVSTPLPNSPLSSSSSTSTFIRAPSLSPCPPPRQFCDGTQLWKKATKQTELHSQQQRQRKRPYISQMVQQKKPVPIRLNIELQSTGEILRKSRPKKSIITTFKPPISPKCYVSKKTQSVAVVKAATGTVAAAAAALALSQEEEDRDLEALTYYPPVYASAEEAGSERRKRRGGGTQLDHGSQPERRRTELKLQIKKRDRTHRHERRRQQLQKALHSVADGANKSHSALSRDNGHGIRKINFSASDNQVNSNTRDGYLSIPNSATMPTGSPRGSSNGLPMPLKKRFMMKGSLL